MANNIYIRSLILLITVNYKNHERMIVDTMIIFYMECLVQSLLTILFG